MISDAQIKQYNEEGYTIVENVFSMDDLNPILNEFEEIKKKGLAKVVVLNGVGCEKFAEHVYNYVASIIEEQTHGRVKLTKVKVFEHDANSATYGE